MLDVALYLILIGFASADEPIVHLFAKCPPSTSADPSLHLTADVPAYGLARCRNGDKQLASSDEVNFLLDGSFEQSYTGERCQFYKKQGVNTYTVDVEVGWGEPSSQVVQQSKIHTISCSYDDHGRATSESETISDWFLNPWEKQSLLGGNASATFSLRLVDVLDNEINPNIVAIGRKVRLVAQDDSDGSGEVDGFRALSCAATNSLSRYYILRAGCGDGLVFSKVSGFRTEENRVFSPYFDAFKLAGDDDTVTFECRFTACDSRCDGDSCSVIKRRKRSAGGPAPQNFVLATSKSYKTR